LCKAQTDLAQCYLLGLGVEKDSETAVRYYRQAATHGNAPAALNLATLVFSGTGTERDLIEADMWATIAMSKFGGANYEDAVRIRTKAMQWLPPAKLEEAHRLVRKWQPVKEES
tara:strand:- start:7818 stop:8159 length:342 start_codon:yes stop_codon:yes gene_type:complete